MKNISFDFYSNDQILKILESNPQKLIFWALIYKRIDSNTYKTALKLLEF